MTLFLYPNILYLSLGLSSKILLKLCVWLIRDIVCCQEEGDGVSNDALVMAGCRAGLTHGPQQTGMSISPREMSHAALEA